MKLKFVILLSILSTISLVSLISVTTPTPLQLQSAFSQTVEKEQIIIKDKIKQFDFHGSEKVSTDYREIYHPLKAFDNKLPTAAITHTFWSDYSNAGFTIDLFEPLQKDVCSAQIFVHKPQNTPFWLTLGNKTVEGILDSNQKLVTFNPCVENVDKINLEVKPTVNSTKWTTISEIKLFAEKIIPPVEPPICPPGYYYDTNLKQCIKIETPTNNSTLILNVSNSSIIINADSDSDIVVNQPQREEAPEVEEQEEEEDEEDDDNKEEKEKSKK